MGCGAVTFPPLELYYGCECLTDLTLRISSNSLYPPPWTLHQRLCPNSPLSPKAHTKHPHSSPSVHGEEGKRDQKSDLSVSLPSPQSHSFLPPVASRSVTPFTTCCHLASTHTSPETGPSVLFHPTVSMATLQGFFRQNYGEREKKQSSCPF